QQLMDPTLDLSVLQTAVQTIFHSGLFEVHKPADLSVNPVIHPNINIETIPSSMPWEESKFNLHRDLINTCLKNDSEAVIQALQKDNTIDINASVRTLVFGKIDK